MAPHFEIYPERHSDGLVTGQHRWRFIAGNGENTANGSEGYANEGSARRAVHQHCEHVVAMVAAGAPVIDNPVIVVVDQ